MPGGHGGGGDGGDGGGGRGDGGGGGGVDGGDGGGDGGAGYAQITKPPAVVSLSLYHAIVSPAAITTLLGPLVPEYGVPPMAILSQHASVSKVVALTLIIASARKVHSSSFP